MSVISQQIDLSVSVLNAAGVRIACRGCSQHADKSKGPVLLIPAKKDTPQVRRALGQLGMSRLPVFRLPVGKIEKQRCFGGATGE